MKRRRKCSDDISDDWEESDELWSSESLVMLCKGTKREMLRNKEGALERPSTST